MKDKIYVWDPLVRSFHWLLLALFVTSYITGENESDIHIYSGYAILCLLTVRIIWGFVGSQHARFSDFVRPVPEAIAYMKALFSGEKTEKHYEGHNPAGGLMVLALLISILCTGFAGLKLYGAEGHGPFAVTEEQAVSSSQTGYPEEYKDHDEDEEHEKHESGKHHEAYEDEEAEEFWEEIHEFFVNLTILLIILHVAGVVLSSRKHNENLVKAMVTGYKEPLKEELKGNDSE